MNRKTCSKSRVLNSELELLQMSLYFLFYLTRVVWTLNEPQTVGRQKANSETQISSSCPWCENKWLFLRAELSLHFPSFIPPSPGAVAFSIPGPLSSGALQPVACAFLRPSSARCLQLPRERRDPVDPFRSPGGGHQPTWAICLHVMEVWSCGGRLGSSQPSGEAQSRRCQKKQKHSTMCVHVCVRPGPALSHCQSGTNTQIQTDNVSGSLELYSWACVFQYGVQEWWLFN